MRFHTAVNKFCWQASIKEPLTIWRTAYNQLRPYLYINDAINAIKFAIDKSLYNCEIYNVLTANLTVKTIVDEIKKYIYDLNISFVDAEIMNQLSYEVSNEKLKDIGFSTQGNIGQGIKETLELIKLNQ